MIMKNINNQWFTLIELIIVITIIVIISLIAFAPYAFYMNKAKVKYTNKELSQAIYEAKNMAKNGSIKTSSNISVWLYFDGDNSKNNYYLYSFPYDINTIWLSLSDGQLIQKYNLQPGIQIDKFNWEDKGKGLILFRAISGSWYVFKWNNLDLIDRSNNVIEIDYSYKWSTQPGLKNSLIYFQDTQIIDY